MFYGRGAGGDPTAHAVVGDLVRWRATVAAGIRGVGLHLRARAADPPDGRHARPVLPEPHVEDRPGVLAEIADHFGRNGVSIERVWQEGSGDEATLVFITHRAQEGAFQKTLQELRDLPCGPRRRRASCAWRARR